MGTGNSLTNCGEEVGEMLISAQIFPTFSLCPAHSIEHQSLLEVQKSKSGKIQVKKPPLNTNGEITCQIELHLSQIIRERGGVAKGCVNKLK